MGKWGKAESGLPAVARRAKGGKRKAEAERLWAALSGGVTLTTSYNVLYFTERVALGYEGAAFQAASIGFLEPVVWRFKTPPGRTGAGEGALPPARGHLFQGQAETELCR